MYVCTSPRDPLVGPMSMYFGFVSKTVYGLWLSVFVRNVSRRLRAKHVWSTIFTRRQGCRRNRRVGYNIDRRRRTAWVQNRIQHDKI